MVRLVSLIFALLSNKKSSSSRGARNTVSRLEINEI
jgi:hypothetical protein